MCGIIGYIGHRDAYDILFEGLKKLEYRGYDSAGIAVLKNRILVCKKKGTVDKLKKNSSKLYGCLGIGHTRWATYGKPCDKNAHPFLSCDGSTALVHNGIIENHIALRAELENKGHEFTSDTDTEVLVHLIEEFHKNKKLEDAIRDALRKVKGSYAIAVISKKEPNKIVVARSESPVVIGVGKGETFVSSDSPAFLKYTRKAVYLEDGEIAVVKRNAIEVKTLSGKNIKKRIRKIPWNPEEVEKAGYEHFMLKEIHEQPRAIRETLRGRISETEPKITLNELNTISDAQIKSLRQVLFTGCGTSFHACLVGKYFMENLAKIRCSAELSSELKHEDILIDPNSLVVAVTQSGETADTIAALEKAKSSGYRTTAIANVLDSSITRIASTALYTRCGPEISVAATKSFVSQLVLLALLSLKFGDARNALDKETIKTIVTSLKALPRDVQKTIDGKEKIEKIARKLSNAKHVFFIGRGINMPIALEGALKLKEISYIHAEGYAAGELKHGPFALLDSSTPVVAIAVKDKTYDMMLNTIGEIKARDAEVIAIADEGNNEIEDFADECITIPKNNYLLSPVLITVIFQMLAYYTAKYRNCAIDMPRNLAKSVTVE